MGASKQHRRPPRTFRSRDLAGLAATLLAGAGLIYTALLRGAPPSPNIAIAAFTAGAILLVLGFGGGFIVDRIGDRYPFLVKTRANSMTFIVLVPVLTFGLLFLWWERDQLLTDLKESGEIMLTTVNEKVGETIVDSH